MPLLLPVQDSQATPAVSLADGRHRGGQWRFHPYRRDIPARFSEEDILRIQAKRTSAIEAVKRCPMYELARSPAVSPAGSAPRTPDPLDMSVSRLQWDTSVVAWRKAFRDLAMQVEAPPCRRCSDCTTNRA